MASVKSVTVYVIIFLLSISLTINADKTTLNSNNNNNKKDNTNLHNNDNESDQEIKLPVLINLDMDDDEEQDLLGNGTQSVTISPSSETVSEIKEMTSNVTMDSLSHLNLDDIEELMMDPLNRTKRQSLAGLAGLAGLNIGGLGINQVNPINNNNGQGKNVESLLASCQLTNLLMYQLLQQKQAQPSPFPAAAIGAFGGINPVGNLIFPQAETLSTYFSTSTFVTTMTSTAIVTIPLLFGNKPSPTTITRTKTYEVTTSQIQTLTSTIRPTFTQFPASALMSTVDLNPTPAINTESTVLPPNSNEEKETDNYDEKIIEDKETDQDASNSKGRLVESETPKLTRTFAELTAKKRLKTHTRENLNEKTHRDRGRGGNGGKRRKNSRPAAAVETYDNYQANNDEVPSAKKTEPFISRRDPSQYKILRDNREHRERPAPAVQQQNSYQPQNPFVYEERDKTPAYNNNRYNNVPTETYQPTGPSTRDRGRGDIIYRQQQAQQYQQQHQQQQQQQQPQQYQRQVEDPEYVQYPDDYAYYARRLKRGQQGQGQGQQSSDSTFADSEEYPLEREYLLEPSFQGDFSQGFEQVEKCPPVPAELSAKTVTYTETRTITKFVNPSSSSTIRQRGTVAHNPGRTYTEARRGSNSDSSSGSSSGSASGSSRGRTRSRSRSTTTTTPTTPTEASVPDVLSGAEAYTGRRVRSRSRNNEQRQR